MQALRGYNIKRKSFSNLLYLDNMNYSDGPIHKYCLSSKYCFGVYKKKQRKLYALLYKEASIINIVLVEI